MRKPVSILALDAASAKLAGAVQQRVAAACGLEDLVQWRALEDDLPATVASIHARRQAPGSPLRLRDDIGRRELVLLVASAHADVDVVRVTAEVRTLYDRRRFAPFYAVEVLLLLPDLFTDADRGAAYAQLRTLSGVDPKPFDEVWLLDALNANRVQFGTLADANDTYAEAIAASLLYEPELSGAMAAHHPRGTHPTFRTFGCAELVFPRDVAAQRLESRFAHELAGKLVAHNQPAVPPPLAAKQYVVADSFAAPITRIGADGGQSLFTRFQAKTLFNDRTKSADELIAAVQNELRTHRDTVHLQNLERLARQAEETTRAHAALLTRTIDETLDRDGYGPAIAFAEALVDPLPDLRADAPRNLVTEMHAATSALDRRLNFLPNHANSDATRKRIRELDQLLDAQQLLAATLAPVDTAERTSAAERLAELQRERAGLLRHLPETLFREEGENHAARNAAVDAESQRLSEETLAREQQLRELFAQKPRFELVLSEALEAGREYLRKQVLWGAIGMVAMLVICFLTKLTYLSIPLGLTVFAIYVTLRWFSEIAPRIRAAREALARLLEQLEATDRARNSAQNEALQFEFDVAQRRTVVAVLRRARESAAALMEPLRTRLAELQSMNFAAASIVPGALVVPIVEDADVDAWYARTEEDRKSLLRELPVTRAQSRQLPLETLREQLTAYAATAFIPFRNLTVAQATKLTDETALTQRLKRFAQYAAPLLELRRDDLEAEKSLHADTTLWVDASDSTFVAQLQRRIEGAHVRPAPDPLRVTAVSRFLHFPGYVIGQLDDYRSYYDEAKHPASVKVPDLIPAALALTPPVRAAYEQVILGRAVGALRLGDGETHLSRAQQLAADERARATLSTEIAHLSIARNVEDDLRQLLADRITSFDREVVTSLLMRQRLR